MGEGEEWEAIGQARGQVVIVFALLVEKRSRMQGVRHATIFPAPNAEPRW
ncbi:hypothetical protein ACFLXC_01100 [Chloroflexota bacterium]